MDTPLKFSLKNIVFAKHMDGTLRAARIIKAIPQHKIYQVSFFNDPSVGYIEEVDIIPFAPDFAKKQKRTILTKMRELKILQKTRLKIFKGIELALQQKMRSQQDEISQAQFFQEEQKVQDCQMQNSRQLTLQQSFQTAKKRRNASVSSVEKEPTKRQKLENEEELLYAANEQVEINQQQACKHSRHQQSFSGDYVAQTLWLSKFQPNQKKEQLKMLEWKDHQKEIYEQQEIYLKEPVYYHKQQQNAIAEVPSITAETRINNSDENPLISTIKQADSHIDNLNEYQAHTEVIKDKCKDQVQQMEQCQNSGELVEKQRSIQSVREDIINNQSKPCQISVEIIEAYKEPTLQPEIAGIDQEQSKNVVQIRDDQNEQQNKPMRAQSDPVEVSQPSHHSSIEHLNQIVDENDGQPIISNSQDQVDNFDANANLIQSPFGNEDEHEAIQQQIALQMNKIDSSHSHHQEQQVLQIPGRNQEEQIIVISDSEAQVEPPSPQAHPIDPIANKQIIIAADKESQPELFIPFEGVFQDDDYFHQPINMVQFRKTPSIETKKVGQLEQQENSAQLQDHSLMQNDYLANSVVQIQQIPQLQASKAQQEPVAIQNTPGINSDDLVQEAIMQRLQRKHESLISPIAEQPQEEDQEQDAEPLQSHNQHPNTYYKVEGMEMDEEDPLEEVSIGKLSKLSVDFKVNVDEERSESESEAISNPVFQILQKKVNWETELSNIESLYKRQFVSPHNYPSLIKALPSLRKKMKELPEPLLAQVVKQYISRIIVYLSAKTQEPAALLSFVQKHIFLASITSEGLSPEAVFSEGILDEFERVVRLYEQGSMRKGWMSNYLPEYLMVKAKLDYFGYQHRQAHMLNEDQELRLYPNTAYA